MARNANFNIKFWENWWQSICQLPDDERLGMLDAIFNYAFFDIEPKELTFTQGLLWPVYEPVINSMIDDFVNGSKGGRPRKNNGLKPSEKPIENDAENPPKNPLENPSENLTHTHTHTHTSTHTHTHTHTSDAEKELFEGDDMTYDFAYQCIAAWQTLTGRIAEQLKPETMDYLQRQKENYTVDEVRDMLEYIRKEWSGTKFEKNFYPKTIFKPENFNRYMNQSKDNKKSSEWTYEDNPDAITIYNY